MEQDKKELKLHEYISEPSSEESVAHLLHLSKNDVETALVSEFGDGIRQSNGYDKLLDTFIH